ncbi:MAG: ribulose-phosphate 3-epimerase [Anaerovoracaceae bacterium]|jgi:ribulose-phosphate 3-epimerase
MNRLAPSILSADFSKLAEEVSIVEKAGAHMIHVDVMDGHFVPNISYGATVMKSLIGKTRLPFDVHLMIENPERYIEDFVTRQTEYIVVHQEACIHLHRTLELIKSFGIKAGVALNPATPINTLECILDQLDLALIMSVNPGFGGQSFIPSSLDKVRKMKEMAELYNPQLTIQVDGGVNLNNVGSLLEAGANLIVAGASVFRAPDIEANVKEFLGIMK